ncbi:MAG: alpha/beta hydrolase [Lachnospiraceae bacterium]|nr:alpha/beta hydrolase [Lachnospiraceae bacterium]
MNAEEKNTENYDIHPDFEKLKKIPVADSLSKLRSLQILFGKRMLREHATTGFTVKKINFSSGFSKNKKIPALIYSSRMLEKDEKAPCLLWIHGGAFLMPALPYHYRFARTVANRIPCRVIMPMYDLAPDKVPPVQQEEVFEVYKKLVDDPESYDIDPGKIIVAGDSAGGTLAAALCLIARDRGLRIPLAQALFYPSLDVRMESESMKKYPDVPICNAEAIKVYCELCRPEEYYGSNDYRSPAEAASLKDIPTAYIETAEFDALHDDGIEYAKRLKEEGCKVLLNETKGTVHAFEIAKNSAVTKKILRQRLKFMRKIFGC